MKTGYLQMEEKKNDAKSFYFILNLTKKKRSQKKKDHRKENRDVRQAREENNIQMNDHE